MVYGDCFGFYEKRRKTDERYGLITAWAVAKLLLVVLSSLVIGVLMIAASYCDIVYCKKAIEGVLSYPIS